MSTVPSGSGSKLTFGLRGSLELPASRALGFYAIVGAATLGGAALTATNIDAITMLFWSAVINGVVAVPIMLAMMWIVTRGVSAHPLSFPGWIKALGWLVTAAYARLQGWPVDRKTNGIFFARKLP